MKIGKLFGTQLSAVINGNPQNGGKMFIKRVPYTAEHPTRAQLMARVTFGEFMYNNAYGMDGTETLPDGRVISRSAYYAMTRYPYHEPGVFGGKTKAQRSEARHIVAERNLQKLRNMLAEFPEERLPVRVAQAATF